MKTFVNDQHEPEVTDGGFTQKNDQKNTSLLTKTKANLNANHTQQKHIKDHNSHLKSK